MCNCPHSRTLRSRQITRHAVLLSLTNPLAPLSSTPSRTMSAAGRQTIALPCPRASLILTVNQDHGILYTMDAIRSAFLYTFHRLVIQSGRRQADLARGAGIDPALVCRFLKSGQGLSMEAMGRLADYLHLTIIREENADAGVQTDTTRKRKSR